MPLISKHHGVLSIYCDELIVRHNSLETGSTTAA